MILKEKGNYVQPDLVDLDQTSGESGARQFIRSIIKYSILWKRVSRQQSFH